jgi:hypothetical protein
VTTTGPVDVVVDTGELGRLRSELEALQRELVDLTVVPPDDQSMGGWDVGSTVDDFCQAWRAAREQLIEQISFAAKIVEFAIQQYETAESSLRTGATTLGFA